MKEALRSGSDINKIYVQDSINKNQVRSFWILQGSESDRQNVPKSKIDGMTDEKHQGIIASISAHEYMDFDKFLQTVEGKDTANVIILDGLEDPIILVRY